MAIDSICSQSDETTNSSIFPYFKSLFKILNEVGKERECHLHLIGDGPKKSWFLTALKSKGIKYTYYGSTFSEDVKFKVLPKCWFGFNGYLKETEVALSYKSIDYLSYGLPLLNSAVADSHSLVEKNKIGYNYSSNDLDPVIQKLKVIDEEELIGLKANALATFKSLFSGDSLFRELDQVFSEIGFEKN